MIIDGRTVEPGSTIESDLCIVGGGPAGIALALQFVDGKTSVVLLESGGIKWDERTQDLADFEVEGPPYFPPRETRVRYFGGTTNAWGGFLMRFDPMDFEARPWVPNSGWPISATAIEPYYEKALPLCGVETAGDEPFVQTVASEEVKWVPIYSSAPARFGRMYRPTIQASHSVRAFLHFTATNRRANDGKIALPLLRSLAAVTDVGAGWQCSQQSGIRLINGSSKRLRYSD